MDNRSKFFINSAGYILGARSVWEILAPQVPPPAIIIKTNSDELDDNKQYMQN